MTHQKGQGTSEHWATRTHIPWTQEEKDQVANWWVIDRLSSTDIAKKIGRTRNSVIGQVHRLGLSGTKPKSVFQTKKSHKRSARLTPSRGGAKVAAATHRSAKVPSQASPPPLNHSGKTDGDGLKDTSILLCDPPLEQRKKLLDLEHHHCRFPLGTPTLFCGRTALEHSSYCHAHARRSRKAA
jgi:hypothetical protein